MHVKSQPFDSINACFVAYTFSPTTAQDESGFIPLNYDDTFAYGCLHEIAIPRFVPDKMFTPLEEKEILIEIYNWTGGPHWRDNTGWRENNSIPHCTWYGVTCHNTTGYVISLSLTNNNLKGTLPTSLWKLRNLQGICISGNLGLEGQLKNFLSPNMTNLLRLRLAYNKLSGGIPGDILVKMKSLVKLQLSGQIGEGLVGEIPEDIGDLTELQVLSLGENRLTGRIPKSITKLKKLWFLDLEAVRTLTGGIENLFGLSSLRDMHLSLSGLGGTLPDDFGNYFPSMLECLLPGNNFRGQIPSSLGKMKNLVHLNLAKNKFSGTIPKGIGTIPLLQIVDFTANSLTSFEDGVKFNSSKLEVLLLAENSGLAMSFESLLSSLELISTSLRILNISHCNFYGNISSKLWDYTDFISVDLSANKLVGTLPPPSDNVPFLLHLDVSDNDLSGKIPQQISMLLALQYLDISGNQRMSSGSSHELPNFMKGDFSTLTHKKFNDKFKCPNARLLYNNGLVVLDPEYYEYRLCLCDVGFYGSSGKCFPCMPGATCHDQMLPASHMTIKAGYWPSPRAENVTHLVNCIEVMGSNSENVCSPSGTCDCWIEWVTTSGKMNQTERVTVCRNSCVCQKGNIDRFCSKCLDGFYKLGDVCSPCPDTHNSIYLLAFLVLVTLVLFVAILFKRKRVFPVVLTLVQTILLAVLASLSIIPIWLFEISAIVLLLGLAGRGKTSRGIVKISIFYVQTLNALISNSQIWPRGVLLMQQSISNIFNLHFTGLGCELPTLFTPLGELAFVLLVPIICVLATWLFYGLACIILKLRHMEETIGGIKRSCLQVVIIFLNLTYFPIVKKTAAVLISCEEDGPFSYMPAFPWLECDTESYSILIILASISLVVYVLGVPLALFLPLLIRFASKRDGLDAEHKNMLDAWLGSIYIPYKKEFRSYFEVLFLLRRMLIAFCLSLIPRTSSFQTVAVCSVLLAALSFQLFFRPFTSSVRRIPLENTIESVVLLVLHISFMNMRFVSLKSDAGMSLVWMVLGINGLVVLALVVSMVMVLWNGTDPVDDA